jgi:hypothetical protein
MQTLGDAFPNNAQRERVQRSFTTGRVFYLTWDLTNGKRDKYSLLVCPNPPPLFLLLNTGMARFIQDTPRLRECQIPIDPETDPTAVRNACFLDCTEVKTKSFDDVVKQVNRDPEDRILGNLCQETLKQAYLALSKDKRIVLGQKVRILEALRPLIVLP